MGPCSLEESVGVRNYSAQSWKAEKQESGGIVGLCPGSDPSSTRVGESDGHIILACLSESCYSGLPGFVLSIWVSDYGTRYSGR